MHLPRVGKDLHHRRKQTHFKDSLPYSTFLCITTRVILAAKYFLNITAKLKFFSAEDDETN